MNNKLDIFFIFILVVSLSYIFGTNIVSLIDKKISNVSINIPPIEIPKSNVIVNVNCDKNKPEVNIENSDNIEHFTVSETKCKNKSIDNMHKYEEPTKDNTMKKVPDDISSFNPAEIYKNFKVPEIYSNKYSIKAANYNSYSDNINPTNLGLKLLPSDNKNLYPKYAIIDKVPHAHNYSFD
jgi:hypothetical protein